MTSKNQSQTKTTDEAQKEDNLFGKLLGSVILVYAVYEYFCWINHQPGIIPDWTEYSSTFPPFTFLADPFLILLFLILGTLIPNYFHQFIQKKIAQSGVLVREKAYKLAEIGKFLCIIFFSLVTFIGYSYLQDSTAAGTCTNIFTCTAALTPEKVSIIFTFIYLIILLFGYFFNNLPQIQSVPFSNTGIVLLDEEEGLYGLQPGQFALIHTLGEKNNYQIFPQNYRPVKGYRLYKSERQKWFVVSEDFFYLENDSLKIKLDLWDLECRYEARICDRHIIDCSQINLSTLESLDQLQSKIESDCIKKFRREITSNFQYRKAYQELNSLYQDINNNPLTLAERSKIYARLISISSQIRQLGNHLQNHAELTIYLYGKLFEVNFQITDITFTENQTNSIIDSFDLVIKNDEMMNKNITQLTSALHKLEGYIGKEQVKYFINQILELSGISGMPSQPTTKKNNQSTKKKWWQPILHLNYCHLITKQIMSDLENQVQDEFTEAQSQVSSDETVDFSYQLDNINQQDVSDYFEAQGNSPEEARQLTQGVDFQEQARFETIEAGEEFARYRPGDLDNENYTSLQPTGNFLANEGANRENLGIPSEEIYNVTESYQAKEDTTALISTANDIESWRPEHDGQDITFQGGEQQYYVSSEDLDNFQKTDQFDSYSSVSSDSSDWSTEDIDTSYSDSSDWSTDDVNYSTATDTSIDTSTDYGGTDDSI